MSQLDFYRFIGILLDTIDIALCLFDDQDRTLLWNDAFLRFFPEHAGQVFPGEPYRENLRRFYDCRLDGEERRNLERYVAEGIDRHRAQTRPFVFTHRGRRLRVASLQTPESNRIRIWHQLDPDQPGAAPPQSWDIFPIDLLDYIADGALILDQHNKIVATNQEFRVLYDVPEGRSVVGMSFAEVIGDAWRRAEALERGPDGAVLDNLRFAGAPFELELPGGRWRRVIARQASNGIEFLTHSDITMLKRQQEDLKRALDELSTVAATDVLTGLANRRSFDSVIATEWARCAREGTPIALMSIDLDQFKSVNDRFGHAVGDECLRRVGAVMKGVITRTGDMVARHGGDEFAILLPNATADEAMAAARSMRRAMRVEDWSQVYPQLRPLTLSIGICAVASADGLILDDLMQRADESLYRAKRKGRDRIELHRI